MPRPHDTRTFTAGEAAALTQTSPSLIDIWTRAGLLCPQRDASGKGFNRRFSGDDTIAMVMIRELSRAGLSIPQLQQAFSVLRAKLATTPPAWRSVALVTDYIAMVEILATTFGRGDGYDQWREEATAYLERMQKAAVARAVPPVAGAEADDVALDRELLIAMGRLPAPGLNLRPRPRSARQVPS